MNTLLAAVRSVHLAAAMLLFGQFIFVVFVARNVRLEGRKSGKQALPPLALSAWWCLFTSVVSGIAWLVPAAVIMSGKPLEQAMRADTLALLLGKTAFGHLWMLRFGLVIALGALLLALRRTTQESIARRVAVGALVVASAYLATLAWAGHANTGEGEERSIQLLSDVVHLLSAGAWLGALPALVLGLASAQSLDLARKLSQRFSTLGAVSLSLLTLSGVTNAWYRVGDWPALIGTDYGRLLLAKLALFAAMATLAMANRWYLLPRLAAGDRDAVHLVRRNAILEIAAGAVMIAVVGVLGTRVPAAHQPPIWPFLYTLSWQAAELAVERSAWTGSALGAAVIVAIAAAGMVLAGLRSHQPRLWLGGLVAMVTAAGTWGWVLAAPAYPTTYSSPTVPFTTDAVARGATLYDQNCSACHGRDRFGDDPVSPLRQSAKRVPHPEYHYPGELFWWIAHGIPGSGMPGFASQLSDTDIWLLIQFLRAQSDSRSAIGVTNSVEPRRSIVAPDFTFEVPGRGQQSLHQPAGLQPGGGVALVVLYTLPQSLPRLRALAVTDNVFAKAGARVIAVPLSTSSTADTEIAHNGKSILATTRHDVAMAYAMYARATSASGSGMLAHAELLIDRSGYLRARWIGVSDPVGRRTADILTQIDLLNREPPGGPAPKQHGH